ncbi:MAG: hypothetical protein ACRD0Q_05740 [Acidimicrobiales bacterium]
MVHRHMWENKVWALTCALGVLLTFLPRSGPSVLSGGLSVSTLVVAVALVPWMALQRRH